jgi:hypothetical protein
LCPSRLRHRPQERDRGYNAASRFSIADLLVGREARVSACQDQAAVPASLQADPAQSIPRAPADSRLRVLQERRGRGQGLASVRALVLDLDLADLVQDRVVQLRRRKPDVRSALLRGDAGVASSNIRRLKKAR